MSAPLHPLAGIREEYRADWQAALRARLASQNFGFAVDNALRVALTLDTMEAAKAYVDKIAPHVKDGDLSTADEYWDEWGFYLLLELKQPKVSDGAFGVPCMTGELIIISPFLQHILHRLEDYDIQIGNQPDDWHRRA
jgi:hypothetical protein